MSAVEQYACLRCGRLCDRMRCPDSWSAETVAKWRDLEDRFTCPDCEALVNAHYASDLADVTFAEDAIRIYGEDDA